MSEMMIGILVIIALGVLLLLTSQGRELNVETGRKAGPRRRERKQASRQWQDVQQHRAE